VAKSRAVQRFFPRPAVRIPVTRRSCKDRRWHNRRVGEIHNYRSIGGARLSLQQRGRTRMQSRVMALLTAAMPAHAEAATAVGWPWIPVALLAGVLLAALVLFLARRARDARTLAALRRSLAAGADWWWRTGADLAVVDVETGDRQIPWLEPATLRGRPPWQPAGDLPTPEAVRNAIDAHAPFFDCVLEVVTAHGSRRIALSGAPLFSATGRWTGYAGTGRELTAPLPVAGGGNAGSEGLRAEFAERERRLELAVKELDSFAHSVSHDLRAPLRVVDGFANIVLEDYGEAGRPLDELGREHLKRIVSAGQRMNSMIDTLLAMSKMTSRELERERVDLSQLARDLADELRSQDPGRRAEFTIADGLVCDGDRTLLRGVLQNLLGNAWKFSVKAEPARIEVGLRDGDGRQVYFVRDNGAGFDMRFADKLFGLFQRFHSANEFPGTGVGLATVQRIVRKHGGRIWAESAPGRGATFYFTLWE
jgi:signal transduction histidine kinase